MASRLMPRLKLVESNVSTALNAPAGAGTLRAIPLVGDCGCGPASRAAEPVSAGQGSVRWRAAAVDSGPVCSVAARYS